MGLSRCVVWGRGDGKVGEREQTLGPFGCVLEVGWEGGERLG